MAKFIFSVDEVVVRNQKSAADDSDSDWLTTVVSVGGANGVKSDTFNNVFMMAVGGLFG